MAYSLLKVLFAKLLGNAKLVEIAVVDYLHFHKDYAGELPLYVLFLRA